jgi:DNA-binding MarR family transcriptional regulator
MDKQPSYYAIIPAFVRYDDRLVPQAKLLYGEITALSEKHGYAWPSNGYFAELYGVAKGTVSGWIRQLETCGHIIVAIDKQAGNQRRLSLTTPIHKKMKGYSGKDEEGYSGKDEGHLSTTSSNVLHLQIEGQGPEVLRWLPTAGWRGLSKALLDELKTAYPACDIGRQFLAMEQWLKANPERAKKSNWRRFVTNWLAKQQDRGGDLHEAHKSTRRESGRGRDTLNEGKSAQYEGVGKVR